MGRKKITQKDRVLQFIRDFGSITSWQAYSELGCTHFHYDRMEHLGVEDIFDAYGNIMVGTDYLVELIEMHGDIGVALMVYNGDSSAMDYANGNCEISNYARGIIERSYQLERLHGKR